jgi:hypothetical protein
MAENIETNYPTAEINKCGEGFQIVNPPELVFIDALIREIQGFIKTKISREIEVSLFNVPENTQLAIIAKPQTVRDLNVSTQQTFTIVFDVVCSDSKVAIQGGTAYGMAVLAMAMANAKRVIGFQYSYSLTFSATPEDMSATFTIGKQVL